MDLQILYILMFGALDSAFEALVRGNCWLVVHLKTASLDKRFFHTSFMTVRTLYGLKCFQRFIFGAFFAGM